MEIRTSQSFLVLSLPLVLECFSVLYITHNKVFYVFCFYKLYFNFEMGNIYIHTYISVLIVI